MTSTPDVIVVGAGVIGLTTAITLAEQGVRVLIRAALEPARTTSAAAGAMIGPATAPPGTAMHEWERATIAAFTELAGDPSTGVHLQRGMLAAPAGAPPAPSGFADATNFEPVAAGDLPAGFEYGLWTTVPAVDMPRYLAYLTDRFTAAGGRIETAFVRSLADVAGEAPLIANCTGVGARDLVPDAAVHAVRGQHVVVANPGLDTFFLEAPFGAAWTSYFPHGDVVVLGGTAAVDDTNLAPDPAIAREIVERCAAVEPRLRDAPVVEHRVGLRPARETPRVEAEQIGPARCVHNYGHGGVGVTLSWGCAREAAKLLVPEAYVSS